MTCKQMTFKQILRGGKIVGEGGQACVIKPAIDGRENSVTKVESKSSSQSETRVSYFLRQNDPDGRYGIYSYTKDPNCKINSSKLLIREGALDSKKKKSKCIEIALNTKDKSYCAFTMQEYTHDLDTLPKKESLNNMFKGLLNLWQGLEFFHSLNVIHGDIKLANIAYRAKYSRKPEIFAFADWGWSIHMKTVRDARGRLNQMLQYRDYAGDMSGGIWSPFMWSPEAKQVSPIDLLKYNDVYSLALMTKDFFNDLLYERKLKKSMFNSVYLELERIMKLPRAYIGLRISVIIKRLAHILLSTS